jgi:hypothetical protein
LNIPQVYIKDKQAFAKAGGPMRLLGKPLDLARGLQKQGCRLIHFIDTDALAGSPANLDVYDGLTYFMNVEVECAPRADFVRKLLSLKCRVVLPPSDAPGGLDVTSMREKRLLVAKIPKGYGGDAEGFHDVVLEDAEEAEVERFGRLGKRVIIYEKDRKKVSSKVWGVISPLS